MEIKIGDQVSVVDEDLSGRVLEISEKEVKFICDDGFEYIYPKTALLFLNENNELQFQVNPFELTDEIPKKQETARAISIVFSGKVPVFDLHIEDLAPDRNFQSQHETLLFQLDYVREVIFSACRKRIRRLVFVHGVGKGKLRDELRNLFQTAYPNIEFFDGSYQRFGDGATEIIIHQFTDLE
tara:strand:- start:898 stop:1446 length:549 start_codon:yes stop_codon:yes gene_type:complete